MNAAIATLLFKDERNDLLRVVAEEIEIKTIGILRDIVGANRPENIEDTCVFSTGTVVLGLKATN